MTKIKNYATFIVKSWRFRFISSDVLHINVNRLRNIYKPTVKVHLEKVRE